MTDTDHRRPESLREPSSPATESTPGLEHQALDFLSRYALLIILVGLAVFFSVTEPGRFFSTDNIKSIASQQVVIVLLGVAATMPLLVGEFDVSVGYVAGMAQAFAIGLMAKNGLSIPIAVVAVLVMATIVGVVNGILVVRLKINALIATLAMGSILTGLVQWFTGGQVIFQGIPTAFTDLAQHETLGIPRPILFALVVVPVIAFYFSFLPGGRRLYAIGGNRTAAVLNGIRVNRDITLVFVASAILSAVAGLLIASQIGVGDPSFGPQFLLPAFTAAFLGATVFRPGRFNVMGTVVGAYVLAVPITGLQEFGVPNWFQAIFNGAALIIAVASSGQIRLLRLRRAERARLRLTTGTVAEPEGGEATAARGSGATSR